MLRWTCTFRFHHVKVHHLDVHWYKGMLHTGARPRTLVHWNTAYRKWPVGTGVKHKIWLDGGSDPRHKNTLMVPFGAEQKRLFLLGCRALGLLGILKD